MRVFICNELLLFLLKGGRGHKQKKALYHPEP